MAIHSSIGDVLKNNIKDEELLNSVKSKFHAIEFEVDGMLNKEDDGEDKALRRAKELITRILGSVWVSDNWKKVEHDIKEKIEESKR